MIEFSSSLKLNKIHTVDGSFNEDPKNIIFFQGGPNVGGGTVGEFKGMGNNRDIYCYANRGWSISNKALQNTGGAHSCYSAMRELVCNGQLW